MYTVLAVLLERLHCQETATQCQFHGTHITYPVVIALNNPNIESFEPKCEIRLSRLAEAQIHSHILTQSQYKETRAVSRMPAKL